MKLTGRTAIVTGAAVRIGRAIALRLAEAGMHVGVHYHASERAAREVVETICSLGVRAIAVSADLSRPIAAAAEIFEQVRHELGPAHVLINSAAIFEPGTLATTDEDNWDRHQNINLKAPLFLSREFARQLPPGERGHIINIADWRGETPIPGHLSYTVAKAGLIAVTKLLAQELGPAVQVNAIAPGPILPAPGQSPQEFARRGSELPLGRPGDPEAIARGVLYLLKTDFVTGDIHHITGGEHLAPPKIDPPETTA